MLAILTTHPIQYQVPLWQALARDGSVPFEVWYLSDHGTRESRDREFGQTFAWDLEMLEGYPHRFVRTAAGATPNTFWRSRVAESLPELFRAYGVKTLWVQGWQVAAYWQAVWAAHRAGVEVWLRGESNAFAPVKTWKRFSKQALLGALFRRVDRFLCIGTANRELYRQFGVPQSKLVSAPYAVDNDRFAAQARSLRQQRAAIRRTWAIPEEAFCILFCGKFVPKKRPLDLVEAVQQLAAADENNGPHLLFAGSGELGTEMRNRCRVVFDAENISSAVGKASSPVASFTGFLNQTEVSRAYVAADCLVLPSNYGETWGLVVNEAMASGLRCIISDRCGCAPDLGGFEGNSVFRCGDLADLADKLKEAVRFGPAGCDQSARLPVLSDTVRTAVALYNR